MRRFIPRGGLMALAMLLVAQAAPAQPTLLSQNHTSAFTFEILKPDFDGVDGTTFSTATFFATARVVASPRAVFIAEVSLSHFGLDGADEGSTALLEKVRPGIYLRIPLDDDLSNTLSSVIGLHFTALFP